MSKAQDGNGVTNERMKRGKVEVIEVEAKLGGNVAQRDAWTDLVEFWREHVNMDEDAYCGWLDFLRMRQGKSGSDRTGTGGDGWGFQNWIDFGVMMGAENLSMLEDLADNWFAPPASNLNLVNAAVKYWAQVSARYTRAFLAAGESAQEVRKRMDDKSPVE